jgi:hypothetical protein
MVGHRAGRLFEKMERKGLLVNQRMNRIALVLVLIWTFWLTSVESGKGQEEPPIVHARTIAIGIPGAGAVARIGPFLAGPLKGAPQTGPGQVLDPNRILVASTSNFGALVWFLDPGTILSIDPQASPSPLIIPEKFAVGGGQAVTLNGAVQVYTANHGSFVNSSQNPLAITQVLPAVSVPTGISIDNAFGRLAFSSSVNSRDGEGWESILDADGRPFKGPFTVAGGVFAGTRTNSESPSGIPGGLVGGSFGTALLGLSVDGSGREVFIVANGDGSIAQAHTGRGVDGLIFKGRLGAYSGSAQAQESWGLGAVLNTRAGMLFQPEPTRLLFICDPINNRILVYQITDNGTVFSVPRSGVPQAILQGSGLSSPVDITPAAVAMTGPISNTSLAPGSDFYVANRGNGTIARLQQDGTVVTVRRLQVDGVGLIGPGWINGIGLSQDGTLLNITLTGPVDRGDRVLPGLLISIPAF